MISLPRDFLASALAPFLPLTTESSLCTSCCWSLGLTYGGPGRRMVRRTVLAAASTTSLRGRSLRGLPSTSITTSFCWSFPLAAPEMWATKLEVSSTPSCPLEEPLMLGVRATSSFVQPASKCSRICEQPASPISVSDAHVRLAEGVQRMRNSLWLFLCEGEGEGEGEGG